MIRIGGLVLAVLLVFLPTSGAAEQRDVSKDPPAFEQLMAESGMELKTPEGLAQVEVLPNHLFAYDRAFASPDGGLEIRYAVRPLRRIIVDYEDPHNSAPDPNHMFPLMFQCAVTLLSNGRHSPTREYPQEQAREKFNADWAAAAVFDVASRFDSNHKQALLVAIHKNGLADAYSVFLFDDYEQARKRIDSYLTALTFLP